MAPKPLSISLGAATSKNATPPPRKPTAAAFTQKKRPFVDDSDSGGDDDDNSRCGKVQLVSGFDRAKGGAVNATKQKEDTEPLVIPALRNRDWRAEAARRKHGKIYVPEDASRAEKLRPDELTETDTTEGQVFGLQTFHNDVEDAQRDTEMTTENAVEAPKQQLTEDEVALAALVAGDSGVARDLVIMGAGDSDWRTVAPENDDDAYRRDVQSRPDVPSLDDYAAVPVEEFGAALLRGMGWKGGDELRAGAKGAAEKNKKKVEKRPAFLGIGAKAVTDVPELGVWGKGDKKGKGRRKDTTYVPVVMVDKKTGKIVDEKEVEEERKMAVKDGDWDKAVRMDGARENNINRVGGRERDSGRGDRVDRDKECRDIKDKNLSRRDRGRGDRERRDNHRNSRRDDDCDRDNYRSDRRDRGYDYKRRDCSRDRHREQQQYKNSRNSYRRDDDRDRRRDDNNNREMYRRR